MTIGSRVGDKLKEVQDPYKSWVPGRELDHTGMCTQSVAMAVFKTILPPCGYLWFCIISIRSQFPELAKALALWGLLGLRKEGSWGAPPPCSEHCGLDSAPGFLAWRPTLPYPPQC